MSNVTRLPTALSLTTIVGSLQCKLPALLSADDWHVGYALPAEYRDQLPEALRAVEASLVPCPNGDFFDAIDGFLEWAELLGIRKFPEDPRERTQLLARLARVYYQTLSDLPADLLVIALAKIQHEHRWHNMPMPAEIRAVVTEDLENRQRIRRRLQAAIKLGRFEEPPLPEDQRAKPEDIAAVRARTVDAPAEQPPPHKEPPILVHPPSDAQMRRILGDILDREQPAVPSDDGGKSDMAAENPEQTQETSP